MKDKRKIIILSTLVISLMLLVGLAIYYILKDDVVNEIVKKVEYSKGEENSQTNDFNDESKWLTYEEYKDINNDVVGLLEFSDRQLPVVQGNNNEEYLRKSIYGDEDIFGVPFVDSNIDIESDDNIIIHAHSTYDKDLLFTFFKDYINDPKKASVNRNFYWTNDNGTYEYTIIAATKINANEEGKDLYWYKWNWDNNMEKTAYVMDMINQANVFYSTSYNYMEKLLTLVTCNMDNDDERYILTCSYVGEVME